MTRCAISRQSALQHFVRAGDTAVVQGVNHAWSNRSDKPCMIMGVMVHAKPYPKDAYPAEGL